MHFDDASWLCTEDQCCRHVDAMSDSYAQDEPFLWSRQAGAVLHVDGG